MLVESENPFLSVIRVWAALAWADDVIAEKEAVALKRLISSALLSQEERELALSWLENRVDLETSNLDDLREDARRGLYRSAAQLATVDGELADQEKALLHRLRDLLSVDAGVAGEIEADVFTKLSNSKGEG